MTLAEKVLELLNTFLGYWIPLMNIAACTAMGMDKYRAQNQKWRIPEKTLIWLAVLGGAAGGLVGMYAFRHKTRHPKFSVGLPVILIVQLVLLWLYFYTF